MALYKSTKEGRVLMSDAEEAALRAEWAANEAQRAQEPIGKTPAEKTLDIERRIIALESAVDKLHKVLEK